MINANSHIRNISTYHENNVIKNISWKGKSLLPLGKAEVLEKIPEKCLKRLLKTEISCVIHKLTFIVRQSQARIKEEEHATSILRWTQDLNRWPSWENSAPWWLLSVPKMIDYIPLCSIPPPIPALWKSLCFRCLPSTSIFSKYTQLF